MRNQTSNRKYLLELNKRRLKVADKEICNKKNMDSSKLTFETGGDVFLFVFI